MIGIQEVNDTPEIVKDTGSDFWMQVAKDAYTTSTTWFDANVRSRIEKNVSMFQSKHPQGSKYNTEAYKYRSRVFRPKVRASIRKSAAAGAVAFFSTSDVVSITPNDNSDEQAASAAINQAILNYRLDKSIPWFRILIGALTDAKVQGIVVSKQQWIYRESSGKVETDRPDIALIPAENFRFSAAADWLDPINTSPYLIQLIPISVGEVKERMKSGEWREHTDNEILSATQEGTTSTRVVRQDGRTDPVDQKHHLRDFDTVWVREYIVRHEGSDVVFWTLGHNSLLTEPVPLKEVYHFDKRPFVLGSIDIEPHKAYPAGAPELVDGLSSQANDIVNQRLDNVKLILNKRYFGKRGRNVDWNMLRRSVPGGIVMMDEFDSVQPEPMDDITQTAYMEQDRVNADIDELLGAFSPSSVASNRQLNETVGGMNLLSSASSALTEYEMMVFAQTWVEPVLRQMLLLIQTYENDQTILALAGKEANIYQKFGIAEITDKLLMAELTCRVNVGFGSTSPQSRIEKIAMGLQAIGQFAPQAMAMIDPQEMIKEVFGALGYKDGGRFFKQDQEAVPPQMQQQIQAMQEEIQRLRSGVDVANIRAQSLIEGKQIDAEARLRAAEMTQAAASEREHLKGEYAMELARLNAELGTVETNLKMADSDTKRGELQLQASALRFEIARQTRQMDERLANLSQNINRDNKVGVITRGDYGEVPFATG